MTTVPQHAEAWSRIVARRPDALLHPTVAGGGAGVTMEERYRHVVALAEIGLLAFGPLDAGSMNVGGLDETGLPRDTADILRTTLRDIRCAIDTCIRLGVGMSASIFEPAFLRVILAFERAGRIPKGTMVKLYFGARPGLSFGLPPTAVSLAAYLQMLSESHLTWFVSVIGGDVVGSGTARDAIEGGGHVVVGIEPYAGERSPTNLELVKEVVALASDIGRPIATPAEAVSILGLERPAALR